MPEFLDADLAYLLGLFAARGQLMKTNGGWRIVIRVPHSYLQTDDVAERQRLIGSLNKIQNRIGELTGQNPRLTEGTTITDIQYEDTRNTLFFRNLRSLLGDATGHENFQIPKAIYEAPDDVKKEFLRGFGDIAAKVRRSNAYYGGRNRVYIDVLSSNWRLPTQLCHLMQDGLKVPVQTIDWGHPNLRNTPKESWTKREHEVKVFCDAYLGIGFYLDHKQAQLERLASENERILALRGRTADECNPNVKARKRNPKHPDEKHEDLPSELRGKHFNGYREICKAVSCWRSEQQRRKQKKLPQA